MRTGLLTNQDKPDKEEGIRKDRLLVLLLLNLSLLGTLVVQTGYHMDEAKLFTFEHTERLYQLDERLNMSAFADQLDFMYYNNTDLSQQNLGRMMDFVLAGARCQPVILDSSTESGGLRWTSEEVRHTLCVSVYACQVCRT